MKEGAALCGSRRSMHLPTHPKRCRQPRLRLLPLRQMKKQRRSSPQALPPPETTPALLSVLPPGGVATAVEPPLFPPQTLPPHETTPPLLAVLPPGGVATAVEPLLPPPQTLPPHETTPPPVTAAGSNDEKIAPLGGTEAERTNSKLDVGSGAYVCRLVGSVGAIYLQQRFCADFMPVSYFVLLVIGLALVSGVAMVRLASHLQNCSSALNFRL